MESSSISPILRGEDEMKPITYRALDFYVKKLRRGDVFRFVRYGNGEWDCILKLYHQTRSGSQSFTPALRVALEQSLIQPHIGYSYCTALQSTSFLGRIGLLKQLTTWVDSHAPHIRWVDGEVFTKASMKGRLKPLVDELRRRPLVVVGPSWLDKLPIPHTFIPVKSRGCWVQQDQLFTRLSSITGSVISLSAGPTAKVLIHRLHPILTDCWLIDFGSLWDPYCGVKSRTYHRRIRPNIVRANFGGA